MKPKAGQSSGRSFSMARIARASAMRPAQGPEWSGSAGKPVWDAVLGDEIGITLPGPYDAPLSPPNQDFRDPGPGIVVARHDRAIGTGGQDRHKFARFEFRHLAARGKQVRGFADRPDHVVTHTRRTGSRFLDRDD